MIRPDDENELRPLAARRVLVAEFAADGGSPMADPGVGVKFDHLAAR